MIWSSYATCVKAMNLLFRNTELCSVLTQYGSQSRYPSEIEVHEPYAPSTFFYAQQVKEFTPLGTLRSELNYKLNELLDAERNGPSMSY